MLNKLIALLLAGAIVAPANIASAHAVLVSASPNRSQVLYKAPSMVSLTFDDDLIVLGKSNQVSVTDPIGKSVTKGVASVSGATITVRLAKITRYGKYKVLYRVVSADGHPVSAFYYFYFRKFGK